MANDKVLYQPWNEEVFLADPLVREMNQIERWMYRSLCQAAFFCSTRPYLPDDNNMLWKLAGCDDSRTWTRHKAKVLQMFKKLGLKGEKLLVQKRVKLDWDRTTEYRTKLSQYQRDRVNKRWQKKTYPGINPLIPGYKSGITGKYHRTELKGTELKGTELKGTEREKTDMASFRSRIKDELKIVFGKAPWDNDPGWKDLSSLERRYGQIAVRTALSSWIDSLEGQTPRHILADFSQAAEEMLRGEVDTTSPGFQQVLEQIAFISQNTIIPDRRDKPIMVEWLKEYTVQEIVVAFREFYGNLPTDGTSLKFAARDFCDKAPFMIATARRRLVVAEEQAKLSDKLDVQLRARADKLIQRSQETNDEIAEEVLGG
jgi:hypothetical protein